MYRREVLGIVAGTVVSPLGGRVGGGTALERPRITRAGETTTDGTAEPQPHPSSFVPLARLPIERAREAVVGPDGSTVFLAAEDGFAVVDVADPADPRLLAERRDLLSEAEGDPLRDVQDVAVDGDRLLVTGPAHAGTDGPRAAILYDVADPADPRQLSVHRTDYPIHNGTLHDGLAYLTANDGEANPVEIVEMERGGGDATGDGASEPRALGRWSPVDADEAWADVPSRLRPIHDVIVHWEVAYCSCWDAGTWLVDVSDPAAPRALGHVGERSPAELAGVDAVDREGTELPGNHHSAAIDESGALLAVGHEAWDADGDGDGGPGGIDLVDVSSPGSPEIRSTVEPPPTDDPSRDGVWTTAHNFELRDGRLYSGWYQGGVRVHDVSDPEEPRELAAWRDSSTARFWTAQLADGADAGDGTGAVVAASMGTDADDGAAGLFTFPRPGSSGAAPREVTATPGLGGFGVGSALLGGGIAWWLACRRGE